MVKCIDCTNCKVAVNFANSYAEARCELSEKTRRKVLASAFTTYRITKKSLIMKDIKEFCKDRVEKKLNNKLNPPKWCPLMNSK